MDPPRVAHVTLASILLHTKPYVQQNRRRGHVRVKINRPLPPWLEHPFPHSISKNVTLQSKLKIGKTLEHTFSRLLKFSYYSRTVAIAILSYRKI